MTIKADHITFNDDGTAWWVPRGDPVMNPMSGVDHLDRPCDTCGGDPWRAKNGIHCPARCIDGRHTFEIKVDLMDPPQQGATITHRVSVVPGMILPIVGDGCVVDGPYVELVTGGEVVLWTPAPEIDDHRSSFIGDGVLPDARPGMCCVKLRVGPVARSEAVK